MVEMKGQCRRHIAIEVRGGCEQKVDWRAYVFCSISSGKLFKVFEEGNDMF